MSRKAQGQTVTPPPIARDIADINRRRRDLRSTFPNKARPEQRTFENLQNWVSLWPRVTQQKVSSHKKMVMPPRTASGMLVMTPDILDNTPITISQQPHERPARLAAHLVRAITPLFCENVVFGCIQRMNKWFYQVRFWLIFLTVRRHLPWQSLNLLKLNKLNHSLALPEPFGWGSNKLLYLLPTYQRSIKVNTHL